MRPLLSLLDPLPVLGQHGPDLLGQAYRDDPLGPVVEVSPSPPLSVAVCHPRCRCRTIGCSWAEHPGAIAHHHHSFTLSLQELNVILRAEFVAGVQMSSKHHEEKAAYDVSDPRL